MQHSIVAGRVRGEEDKARNKIKTNEKVEKLRVRNTVISLTFRLSEAKNKGSAESTSQTNFQPCKEQAHGIMELKNNSQYPIIDPKKKCAIQWEICQV